MTKQFSLSAIKSNELSRTGLPARSASWPAAQEDCTTHGTPTVTKAQNCVLSDADAME
jgi:hypothetical protein